MTLSALIIARFLAMEIHARVMRRDGAHCYHRTIVTTNLPIFINLPID